MIPKQIKVNEIKIANVVATVTLTAPLDLKLIHERLPQTELPGKSPWLKMRLPPNNTYIAFYKSGKFLITVKDPDRLPGIADEVLDLLHKIDLDIEIVKIQIHNVVVHTKIPLKNSLESIITNLDSRKASFEPEQFPGLIYKDWGVSFLLFSSGSCIIAGLKDVKDAEPVIERFKEVIGAK
jgi:transcription initiation factor TFIID TATA-box-binding protein